MIRQDKDYNQLRLFIRYVIGRKSPQKLISYIKDELVFHDRIDLSYTPDGVTLKVSGKLKDSFVPLGQIQDPTCIVYLSIIGATMFASSHATYIKRIDFVKHLRLLEEKEKNILRPELKVIIPNMAPYIKRLNERIGYKAILNKKIGREAGYFFETENFRGKYLIPYHMDRRKFTCTWNTGHKVIFFTHPDGEWQVIRHLSEKNIWCIPAYYKKELKTFISKFNPRLILIDSGKGSEEIDMFGNLIPQIENSRIPTMSFYIREDGSIEILYDNKRTVYKDMDEFSLYLSMLIGKISGEKKGMKRVNS
ncbi:MAG TPA: hypothetical protein PL110_01840 [Candidatus Eremiobacteraeota bacterium]|nr:MAG: hypothetical protein BWY64_00998 [bacterium ADurb.Bin363]HPZ06831.1 hypothetical protein [Candidatus Eremiobacteraeota bacterium]